MGSGAGWRAEGTGQVDAGSSPGGGGVSARGPGDGADGAQWNWAVSVEPASASVDEVGFRAVATRSK